jgi:ectoine hydroxylase-related dioxygenase (phytanoyl-CoA dioxygenase family)
MTNTFAKTDHRGILQALDTYGYCVVRQVISPSLVQELKDEIDHFSDPDRTLPAPASKFNLTFAEDSRAIWQLFDDPDYLNLRHVLVGDHDVCLHRSASILRPPGDPVGGWHSDHCGQRQGPPRHFNDFLNRYSIPSGAWFYLNGSHPDRSGIAVIEKSHAPNWQAPAGFHLDPERRFIYRDDLGETDGAYNQLDIPGAVPVISEPGDLILFSALTYHVNMATHERRYSCGLALRPKSIKIDVPWDRSAQIAALKARLPERHHHLLEGYTSLDPDWKT